MTLKDVLPGKTCVVKNIYANNLRKRIIDMGLITGTKIFVKKLAPLGDPMEIVIRGYVLTLRKSEAKTIEVDLVEGLSL
ncbi:MAG: ferrous iron transport protein A [Firmicutes bacterium]|nr:ferrous iron transport protein A [Bacillota bacterium]